MKAQVDIGSELRERLEPIASAEERTVTQLVRFILRDYLARRNGDAKEGGNQ